MFWGFALKVWGTSLFVNTVFCWTLAPLLLLTGWADKVLGVNAVTYASLALVGLFQFFFWGAWAAYCALQATLYVADPNTTFHWLYYVSAFLAVSGPLAYLTHREMSTAGSADEAQRVWQGARWHSWFTRAAFIAFCIWPVSAAWSYGWLLRWLVA